MKKNLKKVISAVLSLTLAISSFVALSATGSAATFTDVADTASYSEAVEALAALGAISGYEDGTFLPNNNITRAEVTTMVVAALNMTEDAKNSGSTTKFADVNANAAWAAGYVNIGVAQGFISGMSDTEFAPSENVTYAQVLSMLTRILGYGDFAVARGGYPTGYLTAASTAGILSGVSASANDAMTRAQVAQLIWNAVQAPMLDITTFSTSVSDQEMQKMDGKNDRDFKTVLSSYFSAYVLNVTVDATSKDSNSGLNSGEIKMSLTNSNDWDPELEKLVSKYGESDNKQKSPVAVGKTAAESYLFSSAKVVAEYNDDDEWTLLYFAPTSKVTQKEVDGTLVAEQGGDTPGVDANYIRIKKAKTSGTTTNYKLSTDAMLYVNGVEYGKISDKADAVRELLADSTGNTILVEDSNKSGYYSQVLIDYYITARVTTVNAKSTETKISLSSVAYNKSLDQKPGTSITIDPDDVETGDVTVSVVRDGNPVELSALVRDDVVSIAYDVTTDLTGSTFFEIIASTDSITGKFSSYDEEEELYSVDGQEYEAVVDLSGDLTTGTSYTFYRDAFGRFFTYDEEASTKNFAIVERYINVNDSSSPNYTGSSASEYNYINVMTLDGQSKSLNIEGNYDSTAESILTNLSGFELDEKGDETTTPKSYSIKTSVAATAKAVPIQYRIIEYTVKNSNGRINKISQVTDYKLFSDDSYKESTNRLNQNLASTAAVLDATDYDTANAKTSDYKASSLAALVNDVDYDGILVYRNSNSEYAYVIITKAGSTYGATSNFVVAAANGSSNSQTTTTGGDDVYSLYVMQPEDDNKATQLYISQSVVVYSGDTVLTNGIDAITRGSIFYYTTDSDGYVDEISVVYDAGLEDNKTTLEKAWADLIKTTDMSSVIKLPKADTIDPEDWDVTLVEKDIKGDTAIQLLIAPVFKTTASTVTVAPIVSQTAGYAIDTNGQQTYSFTADSNIYAIDMTRNTTGRNAFSSGSFSAVAANRDIDDDGYVWLTNTDENVVTYGDTIQMAFLMVVDGVVTNALVFDN